MTAKRSEVVVLLSLLLGVPARAQDGVVPPGYQPLVEAAAPQYDVVLNLGGAPPVDIAFAIQDPGHYYRLRVSADKLLLERVNGEATRLSEVPRPAPGAEPSELMLRRRTSALYVVIDKQLAIDVLDGVYGAGWVAAAAPEGAVVQLAENGYQPVEDIYFADDFMRTKDQQQLGVWRHMSGKWRFYSVLETNERADVNLSVNPFSLGLDADGETPAAVVTGHPFWCDYDYQASVRCRGGGWAGILFGQRADDDYYLLRADLQTQLLQPRRIELVRVKGGAETVLTGGTTLLSAEQWYRLGVRLRGPRVQCLLDGGVIFDLVDPEAIGGPVGLWTRGRAETLFDDIKCVSNFDWPFDRTADLKRNGVAVRGDWRLEPAAGNILGDPGPRALVATGPAPAEYVIGDPNGDVVRLEANVRFDGQGKLALLFAYRDQNNYQGVEWDTKAGTLRWWRTKDGQREPGGLVRDRLEPGATHSIALDLLSPGHIQVRRDGMLRMRVDTDGIPPGRLGLATDGVSARFDGLRLRWYVPVDSEVDVDNSHFADDPFMLHWASPLADWFPKGTPQEDANGQQIYWHKGDFYQAYRLELPAKGSVAALLNATEERWRPPADATIQNTAIRIERVEDQQDPGDGYSLYLIGGGTEQATLRLFRQGEQVVSAALPADAETITVAHDGGVTWVEANGKDVLVYHDHQPLTGPRVALRVAGNDVLYNVKCRREGIIDEVFDKAPAAWVQQGEWIITNRFSCTPTWSHMTALERDGLGAIWHKDAFPGRVTVEYYAGMRMQSDYAMIYPRCGDFNCTFAARPFDLASGVSLIPGAWDPGWTSVWTRYVRGNNTITETDRPLVPRTREDSGQRYIPVPYISSGRDVHGAWYYVKSRYVDGRLHAYFDNVEVLDAEAPKVDGDRVAFWTQNNQIVLARVRITYQNKVVPGRLLDRDPAPQPPSYGNPLLLSTNEAPGIAFDFEDGLEGWAPRDRYRNVHLTVGRDEDRNYLFVRNELPGGSFEAVMPLGNASLGQPENLPLTRAAVLRFDYRIPPETRINAYATIAGRRYAIPLTGPAEDSDVLPVLLKPDGIKADGQWHTCRLPLGAALRRRFGKELPTLTDFRFGMCHEGYLLAGFGGNPRGAWYAIDNLAIVPETQAGEVLTPLAKLLYGPGENAPSLKALRAVIDRQPGTVPTAETQGPLPVPSDAGVVWLHAQGVLDDGAPTAVAHLPLLVANGDPAFRVQDEGQAWDGGPVQCSFGDFAPVDVTFTVADRALEWRQAASVDAENRRLILDPSPAGLVFEDGQKVSFVVKATFAGGGSLERSFERIYSRAADQRPPTPPRVRGAGFHLDMEYDPLTVAASSETVLVRPDPTTAPDGDGRSAKIVNLVPGGAMQFDLYRENVDLGAHPLLMFDYKCPEPVRSDLVLYLAQHYFSLGFTDLAGSYPLLGRLPDVVRDEGWHRAQFNVQQALAGSVPFGPRMYALQRLLACDGGYSGPAPGAAWWLDNLRLVKVTTGLPELKLSWAADDAGGIAAYRYGLGDSEDVAPTTEVDGAVTEGGFRIEANGLHWFAIQARDRAGNWSRITRVPILVDNTPPAFGAPTPAPGPLGTWNIEFPVTGLDVADLDPASLRLTVNDQTVGVNEGEVEYNSQNHTLAWNWAWATKQFGGPVADGTALAFKVTGKDLAGNPAPDAAWSYAVSYAADQQPPLAPEVTIAAQPVRNLETFTQGLGRAGVFSASYSSPRRRVIDPDRHDYVCQVSTNGTGVLLHSGGADLTKFPYLSFDYKLSGGVVVHLLAYINQQYFSIALNGRSRSYRQIGQVEVQADGKWHTAVVDLLTMARTVLPNADTLTLSYVILNEYGSNGGVNYWLDNIALFGPMPKEVAASWVCYDATGITGAAATFTEGLGAAEPSELRAALAQQTFTAPKAGTYLLQVRCQDGAGNWGGTARRVVVVP